MAWNEPGNNGQRDPWNRNRQTGNKPGLEDMLKQLRNRFGKLGGGAGGIFTILLAFVIVWVGMSSFTIVDARQAGVVLRFGKYARTLQPGFHLKAPSPIETVTKVGTTEIRSVSDKVRMLTSDENIISVDFNVQYQVSDARKFLFSLSGPPEETLRQAAEAAVRTVVGANVMDNILTSQGTEAIPAAPAPAPASSVAAASSAPSVATAIPTAIPASAKAQTRDTLQQQTREILQATLDEYDAGLMVTDVSFQNVAPPQEVKDAFDDVNAAREDKQGTENNARAYSSQVVPVARGDASRIAAEAQGYAAARVATATGDASRFNLILKEYKAAPDVTRRRLWLETVEDVMSNNPKVLDGSGGRNMIYLPLDRTVGKELQGVGSVMQSAGSDSSLGGGKEKQP
ncbi:MULTISPECIES: FtsH protease activity modulator HflK [Dyella]|uniref:FtsH protease activity modulator HflK n=1 Tax=Dyella TaxID=231454 RepID=UPI000C84A1AE|nr:MULTISPECIES: FtsH protease activity modulator HflK [Dyella]MDR3446297.1 FtsH protease activity modulator HflK [Dyella sp.]PMQ02752.1 Modulator of FtsH protease HflK [Dyella sp. AD56]ULU24393.1 FtsH protease activity modulator HflK [Dyella terrae]